MESKNVPTRVLALLGAERLTGADAAETVVDVDEEKRAFERAITLVKMRAATIGSSDEIPSPCISVCRMSDRSGLCQGCFRTGDEIAGWSSAGIDGKLQVWKRIEQRMAALQA